METGKLIYSADQLNDFFIIGNTDLKCVNLISDKINTSKTLRTSKLAGHSLEQPNTPGECHHKGNQNFNTNESFYSFLLAQQNETKTITPKRISYHYSFEKYTQKHLPFF